MAWTHEEQKRIKETFLGLAEIHRKELSKLEVKMYWRILERYEAKDVYEALVMAIETTKFFPKPTELIELIMGTAIDRASLAWMRFLDILSSTSAADSVEFEDTRLSAIVDFFGGWDAVHIWRQDEMTWRRLDFVKIYAGFRYPPPGRRHIGAIEHYNTVHGFLNYVPKTMTVPKIGQVKQHLALPPPRPAPEEELSQKMLAYFPPGKPVTFQDVQRVTHLICGGTQ
jgi:hypothetical protein